MCVYKSKKDEETRHNKIGLHLANSTSPKGTQVVGADPLLIEGIVLKLSEIRSLQRVKRGPPHLVHTAILGHPRPKMTSCGEIFGCIGPTSH